MYSILKGVSTANDPVAVYPLTGTIVTRDASMCNNGEAEMLDESGNKMSDVKPGTVSLREGGIRTIRITNNNGNLKIKSLTIVLRVRVRTSGSRIIVAFSAQGKSVLLFSLHWPNEIRVSLNSSDGEYLSAGMMVDSKGKVKEREWYLLAVTYNHTSGIVTLYSSEGERYRGVLGTLELEEPEYVYLGNNVESVMGGSNEQHSLEPLLGRLECFMLYRRSLAFSEILQAMNLCQNLPDDNGDDDDYDNGNDNHDESGGKLSFLILHFVPSFG